MSLSDEQSVSFGKELFLKSCRIRGRYLIIQLLCTNVLSITCRRYEYRSKELDRHVILCNVMIVLLPPLPRTFTLWL